MRKSISQGNCVTVWCLDEPTSWLVCCGHFDRLSVCVDYIAVCCSLLIVPLPFQRSCLVFSPRFMESELDLNDIIQEMHVVATMPDLYHLLVELNAVQSLLGLLGHDNTDILSALSSVRRRTCWGNTVYFLFLSVSADLCCHVWCSVFILIISHLETHTALYSFESLFFYLLISLG